MCCTVSIGSQYSYTQWPWLHAYSPGNERAQPAQCFLEEQGKLASAESMGECRNVRKRWREKQCLGLQGQDAQYHTRLLSVDASFSSEDSALPANSGNQRYIRCMTLGLANSQPGRRSWNHTHMLPLSLVSLLALKAKMDKGIIITNNPFTVRRCVLRAVFITKGFSSSFLISFC